MLPEQRDAAYVLDMLLLNQLKPLISPCLD
jgi:hypothetical protein